MNLFQAADVNLELLKKDNAWAKIPTVDVIEKTADALRANNFDVEIVEDGGAAREKVLKLIPKGAEVMTMTSETLETVGIASAINESAKYEAVKPKLYALNRERDGLKMQKMGAAPEWVVGSVHALTQDGKAVIASNTGSQLSAYAYGSLHVVWIVGAQKIVKDLDSAFSRLDQYTLPLEADRASKAYGMPGSYVSKLLVINQEVVQDRIKIIIVKEELGF